ncbi:MAG: hypothetical protein MHM6MM_001648 [Cercozoa sp. M6MM]
MTKNKNALPVPKESSSFDDVVVFDVLDEPEKKLTQFAATVGEYRSYVDDVSEALRETKIPLDVIGIIEEFAKNRAVYDEDIPAHHFPHVFSITQGISKFSWSEATTRLLCTWGFSEFKIAYARGQGVIDESFDDVASDYEDSSLSASLLRRLVALDFPVNAFEFYCNDVKLEKVDISACTCHDEIDKALDKACPNAFHFEGCDGHLAAFAAIVRLGADDLCRHDKDGYWKQLPPFKLRKQPPPSRAPSLRIGGYGLFQPY